MSIKETFKHMKDLLGHITHDLEKAENGNKAASQRVRTGTVKLEKLAKVYRKESIKTEKQAGGTRKTTKKSAKPAVKSAAKKSTAKASTAKVSKVKAKPKAKAHKAVARSHAMSFRKPTAKLPVKHSSFR